MMSKPFYGRPLANVVAEALGLADQKITQIDLSIPVDGVVAANVRLLVTKEQAEKLGAVFVPVNFEPGFEVFTKE